MKVVAVSNVPAHYHTPIYRELSSRFGDGFLAIFRGMGYAGPTTSIEWNADVTNNTGVLEGFNYKILNRGVDRNIFAVCRELITLLRRSEPHAILVNSHRGLFCRTAIEYGASIGARIILRSTPYDLGKTGLAARIVRELYLRFSYRNINAFAAVGTLPRIHFEHYSNRPHDVFFSPYCTDEFYLNPISATRSRLRARFRTTHDIHDDEFVFLFCGRFAEVKRIDWVVRAFERFRRSFAAKLIIAGNGPLYGHVENLVSHLVNDVILTGFQHRDGVTAALSASDALLLPSKSETWGVVVNEAMMFNLPVVASSNVAAAVDMVEEEVTGFVFPSHSEDAFVKSLFSVHELVRSGIDVTAFRRITKRFSAHNAVRGIVDAIDGRRS